jgi:hypothetical protein
MSSSASFQSELERRGVDADFIGRLESSGGELYQGSAPPPGHVLSRLGFDVLVLTAEELLPLQSAEHFPGLEVILCPLHDHETLKDLRPGDMDRAAATAKLLADRLRDGKQVLVTCNEGRNRSGLIDALVTHLLTGKPGAWCVNHVRSHRFMALRNPLFVRELCTLGPRCT